MLGPDAVADCLPLLQPIALTPLHPRDAAQTRPGAVPARARGGAGGVPAGQAGPRRRPSTRRSATGPVDCEKPDKKAVRAEQRAEKRAIDEALDEAREEDLLTQIRHQVLLIRPQAPVEPARLERIRPRTLISFIAGAIGAYFLLSQLTHIEFGTALRRGRVGLGRRGRRCSRR